MIREGNDNLEKPRERRRAGQGFRSPLWLSTIQEGKLAEGGGSVVDLMYESTHILPGEPWGQIVQLLIVTVLLLRQSLPLKR